MTFPDELSVSMNEVFILIVEDEPDHAALIQAVFDSSLAQVKTHLVVSGWEARRYLVGEWPYEDRGRYPLPSLIVLDLGLPDSTGFEVLAWLAEQEALSPIPVIVLTGSGDPEHRRRVFALGARRFLDKRYDFGRLMEAVKEELHPNLINGGCSPMTQDLRVADPLRRNHALKDMLDLARSVIADGVITDAEAEALQRWVEHNPDMIGVWPARNLIWTLRRVLYDGYLNEDGRAELLEKLADMIGEGPYGSTALR